MGAQQEFDTSLLIYYPKSCQVQSLCFSYPFFFFGGGHGRGRGKRQCHKLRLETNESYRPSPKKGAQKQIFAICCTEFQGILVLLRARVRSPFLDNTPFRLLV